MSDQNPPPQPENTPQGTSTTNNVPPAAPYPGQSTPVTPTPIVYPNQPNPYAAPGYAQTGGYAPVGVKKTLSVISLVGGIVGVTVWILPLIGNFLAFAAALAAIICGFLARTREPQASKGFWITGIILGFVSMGFNLLALIGLILLGTVLGDLYY